VGLPFICAGPSGAMVMTLHDFFPIFPGNKSSRFFFCSVFPTVLLTETFLPILLQGAPSPWNKLLAFSSECHYSLFPSYRPFIVSVSFFREVRCSPKGRDFRRLLAAGFSHLPAPHNPIRFFTPATVQAIPKLEGRYGGQPSPRTPFFLVCSYFFEYGARRKTTPECLEISRHAPFSFPFFAFPPFQKVESCFPPSCVLRASS